MKKIKHKKRAKKNYLYFLFLFIISFQTFADVTLKTLTTFNTNDTSFNFDKIIHHPAKNNHFYVYNSQGLISQLINGDMPNSPLIDLSQVLSQSYLKLTAVTLHPNFHLKDLPGYHVIYTAHQEKTNTTENIFKLPETPLENSQYDLVINEWRLQNDATVIDITTQREIIRIASPQKNNTIQQISFNPYLKPWQSEFGALYIVLNQASGYEDEPLYSGAILRINPDKFGLRNYTIPEKNPFSSNKNVANEIVAYGMHNMTRLLWDKTNNDQWFYIEDIASESTLKKVKLGHTSEVKSENALWHYSNHKQKYSIVWYEGSKLSQLLYQFITLEFISGQWQLNSIDVTNNTAIKKTTLAPIPSNNHQEKFHLSIDNHNELILLNLTNKTISNITKVGKELPRLSTQVKTPLLSKKQKTILLWVLIALLILVFTYVVIKKIREFDKEKSLVRKLYAKFNFIHHNEEIELYKRHQNKIDVTVAMADIKSCNVLLNNEVIATVNRDSRVFDEEIKHDMLQKIALERRLKMVDNRARLLIIEVMTTKKIKYQICLYVRRGNQRYTRKPYQECISMATYFCTTISEKINPNH